MQYMYLRQPGLKLLTTCIAYKSADIQIPMMFYYFAALYEWIHVGQSKLWTSH